MGRLILWTGPKHSGKTTAAAELVRQLRNEGFSVAGLLAPAIYEQDKLVGFDAMNVQTEECANLATRNLSAEPIERFEFTEEGKKLGKEALSITAVQSAQCVVVDEFGPLELAGDGWREDTDRLLTETMAVVLLVVRDKLLGEVEHLYKSHAPCRIPAAAQDSVSQVIGVLKQCTAL